MKTLFINLITATILITSCNINQAQQPSSVIQNIDAKQFKALVDSGKGIILDVRTPEEVSEGYINNAKTINIHDADFTSKINLLQKDKEVYVYCRSGGRSSKAAEILKDNGFSKVYNLQGGITAWKENGFPVAIPAGK